jgi:hypothetical protein
MKERFHCVGFVWFIDILLFVGLILWSLVAWFGKIEELIQQIRMIGFNSG